MASGDGRHNLPQTRGTVILSINLELDVEHTENGLTRRLDAVRSALLEATSKWSIPATWAVADPMLSAATEPILRAAGGHEIAVLGDRAWLGTGCGRDRLARELARRFSVPSKAGIPVHSLILRNVEHVTNLELLVEHGVMAFCGPPLEAPPDRNRTTPIHFGLWQPPSAWRLPPHATWWSPTAWQVRREAQRAACTGGLVHLHLDAVSFLTMPNEAAPLVHWLFSYMGRLREAGRIELTTVHRCATAALHQRAGIPSRSVLRPAA